MQIFFGIAQNIGAYRQIFFWKKVIFEVKWEET